MRIGIEAQRILRTKKHGMDMVALQLIRSLQKIAPENEYVIFVRPGDDASVLSSLLSVEVVYVRGITYADWEQVWLPIAILKQRIDVMHFTSNTASLFCPVPYVLTLHDIIFLENGKKSKSWYQKLGNVYRQWVCPLAIKRAEKVVTVSIFESGQILNRFPEMERKLRVIYNAAAEKFSPASQKTTSKKFNHLPDRFLLFLGNTDPKKNTDNVIRAYAHYRNQLNGTLPLVIGDYPRKLVEKILVKNGDGYLLEDIISLGYIRQFDLAALYRKATGFLYPSVRESFGIPILEAMASHCPVITSHTSSMPEVAEDAAVLINPSQAEELANAMLKIEIDKVFRNELIAKGDERVRDFSWNKSAKQYAQLYDELFTYKMLNKLSIQNL
ncbi:MAG TPA: glycosyltransferase family 1 protein [Cyclobacteriaceae bacterium]|jgi:glycosyltransferase involved in cell wall biosynthesis|nr:glycosyltransferase family 1 protein [Cyclobacteriaceae bacterium]